MITPVVTVNPVLTMETDMTTQKTKKVNVLAAVATLVCGALAVGSHAAGLPYLGVMWTGAALVWSWNIH